MKRVCNADEKDVCIFSGNGSTQAVNLLIEKLRIRDICQQVQRAKETGEQAYTSEDIDKIVREMNFCEQNRFHSQTCKLCKTIMPSLGAYEKHALSEIHQTNLERFKESYTVYTERPIVILSIFEHNANLIPWRETGADVILVPMTESGDFDYDFLQKKLALYKHVNTLKVGAFCAGSNLTGTLIDVDRISVMCHKANFLACFDYAATAPYVDINMNGPSNTFGQLPELSIEDAKLAWKDAIYFSPHKLVGGPGSSGVLLAKKKMLGSSKPQRLGGGIVFFVNELEHEFLADKQEREESGTPGVIQDIRAGLVFQLKEAISCATIHECEKALNERVLKRLSAIDNLFLLGNNSLPKVSIWSFVIKSKFGKILHPNFVT